MVQESKLSKEGPTLQALEVYLLREMVNVQTTLAYARMGILFSLCIFCSLEHMRGAQKLLN